MLNTVTVTKRTPVTIEKEDNFEVLSKSDVIDTQTIEGVYNIKENRNYEPDSIVGSPVGETYVFPDLTFETVNGDITVQEANIENPSELEHTASVTLLEDKPNSDEGQSIEHYDAYGVTEHTYINNFDNECSYVTLMIDNPHVEGGITNLSPTYRGVMVQFMCDVKPQYYGSFNRHSLSVQNRTNPNVSKEPPVESDGLTFTVGTDKGEYSNVVNVRRGVEDIRTFGLQLEDGNTVYVSTIYDASGSFYTLCVQTEVEQRSWTEKNTTGLKRLIGVYKNGGNLYAVSHPQTASVSRTPIVTTFELDNITNMHLKRPDGKIVSDVPSYCTCGASDIPSIPIERDSIESNITKDRLKQLLRLRLSGELEVSEEPDSDFQNVVEGYPELELLLRKISDRESLYKYEKILPHQLLPKDLYALTNA